MNLSRSQPPGSAARGPTNQRFRIEVTHTGGSGGRSPGFRMANPVWLWTPRATFRHDSSNNREPRLTAASSCVGLLLSKVVK